MNRFPYLGNNYPVFDHNRSIGAFSERVILTYLYFVIDVATNSADDIDKLRQDIKLLSRQMMMQQFYIEEITRSNSNSGLKRVKILKFGQRPHLSSSHVDTTLATIHNRPSHIRTPGLGEMVVVLNGIEFQTRHSDFLLKVRY